MTKCYLVLGGYSGIGKTTFLKGVRSDFIDDGIGVNVVKWNNNVFYDLSGDLKYRNYIGKYFNEGDIIILCYRGDIDVSFHSISSWIQEIKNFNKKKIIILLDLHKKRTVIRDEASFYCINNGYYHYDLDFIGEKEFIENIVNVFSSKKDNRGCGWGDLVRKYCCCF